MRRVPVNVGERLCAVAVTPLWLVCTAGWGAGAAVLLTWTAAQERTAPPR